MLKFGYGFEEIVRLIDKKIGTQIVNTGGNNFQLPSGAQNLVPDKSDYYPGNQDRR